MTNSVSVNVLPPGRRAGVCLHITSLPGPYGIGELGQRARDFIDAMKEMNYDTLLRELHFFKLSSKCF